jgi:hypothetical protein
MKRSIKASIKAKPCPFCGSPDVITVGVLCPWCDNCDATGPLTGDIMSSVKIWNIASDKVFKNAKKVPKKVPKPNKPK